jgi:leader peptidase (prepilin peptidase) / N-methyltransferase
MDLLQALQTYPLLALVSALILGLLVGSFLNVVIHRLPRMINAEYKEQVDEFLKSDEYKSASSQEKINLVLPRSRCPHCGHQITALENIPVVSYLFLRGRCSGCKKSISKRYPIVELVTGIFSLVVIYHFGATWQGAAALLFTWCLISLTLIDYDTYYLPDVITLPLIWIGLIANYYGLFTEFSSAFWGAIIGYMSLWTINQLFKLIRGREGMGAGDFKLFAALGAWAGWQMLLQIALFSSLVGAVVGISLMFIKNRDKNHHIPYGPYLAVAGWIAFLFGEQINQQYLKILLPH